MKHILTLSLVVVVASACTAAEPEALEFEEPSTFEIVEPEYDGFEEDGVMYLTPDREQGSVCECTTDDCVREWVQENLGCGLCVSFDCVGGPVGACALCDDETEAPAPTHELGSLSDTVERTQARTPGSVEGTPGADELAQECGAGQQLTDASGMCTNDLAAFCGCDGETFYASSSCPGKAYAHVGACSASPSAPSFDTAPL